MAAKSQHVHDSCVVERRLRPIYDWLDVGNNKKALQEIEKVLKKSPSLQCAKALRCLASLRLGREQEALSQLDALAEESPSDDATLQVMTICYRESQQLDKVCRMYEAAVKVDPNSEELHTHLFMAHVRVGHLEKQQHCAMQLYKLKPKNPYYFWTIMSIVLQATRGAGAVDVVKRGVLLALASRMMERLVVEGRLEAEQELQLYLAVLALQGRHEDALQTLTSPLAIKLLPPPQNKHRTMPLLTLLKRWRNLNITTKDLLRESPDRWDYYDQYYTSAFHLMRGGGDCGDEEKNVEGADDTPEKCAVFLSSIIQQVAETGKKLRGPYLARLELLKRLQKEGMNTEGVVGSGWDLIVDYFREFGSRACSVSDLRPFLNMLPPDRLLDLPAALQATTGLQSDQDPYNEDTMQRHIGWLQLSRCCGCEPPVETLMRALRPPPPAPSPTDPYSLLLAHHCHAREGSAPLLLALRVLHNALNYSPTNFHCKLLAIKIYHMIGCGMGAQAVYETLDVKHVQLDSLGHIHCSQLYTTGLLNLTKEAYDATVKFFTQNYKDSVDHLIFSYKFGSFMKLEELMEWRERLQRSLHHAACLVGQSILNLIASTTPAQAAKAVQHTPPPWDLLRDNRDLGVFTSWEPLDGREDIRAEEQFNLARGYARLRSLVLSCLEAAATEGTDSCQRLEGSLEEMVRLATEMEQLIKKKKTDDPSSSSQNHVGALSRDDSSPSCRGLRGWLKLSGAYQCWIGSITKVRAADPGSTSVQQLVDGCQKCLQEALDAVCSDVEELTRVEDPLSSYRETMENVVNFAEFLSVACVVASHHCSQRGTRSNKGGRRGAKAVASTPVGLPGALTEACERLVKVVAAWPVPSASAPLHSTLANLSLEEGHSELFPEGPVLMHIMESHAKAVLTLSQVVRDKLKFLSAIANH